MTTEFAVKASCCPCASPDGYKATCCQTNLLSHFLHMLLVLYGKFRPP